MSTDHDQRSEAGNGRLHALDAIRSWPEESRKPASWIIHVHREPTRVSEAELVWENVGPWQRVIAMREFHERDWPVPHTASVRTVIAYAVPEARRAAVDDLDLAIEVDQDRGLVQAVGPDLRTNLLMFNLMHDVVQGTLESSEARRRYADLTTAAPSEHPPADMLKCRFDDNAATEPTPVRSSNHEDGASPPADPATDEHRDPSAAITPGVHEAMPSPQPDAEPESDKDTDRVAERRRTRQHGDDVDEAAERSSGFDLDDTSVDDDK